MIRARVIEFVAPGVEALAQGLGLFADAGLELEITRTRSSTEQREALDSGRSDIGLTAIDNVIAWNGQGSDLRLVGQVERTTLLDLIAASTIATLGGLRGATIAVDAVDTGFAIALRHALRMRGLGDDHYLMRPVGGPPQRFAAVQNGEADAALVGPPWTAQAQEAGLSSLLSLHLAYPHFPGIGVVVDARRQETLLPELVAYLRALDRALDWVASADREEALSLLAAAGFPAAGGEGVLSVCPLTLDPSPEGLQLLFDIRRDLGMLPATPNTPEQIIDLSALTDSRA